MSGVALSRCSLEQAVQIAPRARRPILLKEPNPTLIGLSPLDVLPIELCAQVLESLDIGRRLNV
jgi:hypothetical protein